LKKSLLGASGFIQESTGWTIERYKARLVAKEFTQTYGVDYLETSAPIAKMNMVKVILSLTTNHEWNFQQFNV